MKFILLSLLLSLTTGCVGMIVMNNERQIIHNPTIKKFTVENSALKESPFNESTTFVAASKTIPPLNRKQVIALMGPPSKATLDNNIEKWYYQDAWTNKGVVLLAVLFPLPLVIPYKHYEIELSFLHDRLVKSVSYNNITPIYYICGLLMPKSHEFVPDCTSHND